jgi:hypothetical protein
MQEVEHDDSVAKEARDFQATESPELYAPEQQNFSETMDAIAADTRSIGKEFDPNKPDIVQDGGYEIHPDLEGIQFNFWISPKPGKGVAVNFSGNAEKAPWAHNLTGKVFKDFTVAKGWLRQEAERLSKESK